MAVVKYKEYKNGIYGYRYRKHYISLDRESGLFSVYDPSLREISSGLPNRYLAEKDVLSNVSEAFPDIDIEKITALPLYKLDSVMLELANKKDDTGISESEGFIYDIASNEAELREFRKKHP